MIYGRKWKVLVLKADGTEAWSISDSDNNPNSLRVTFNIEQCGFQTPWYSEVAIYNLAGDTTLDILAECNKEGSRVIVEAGYQGDQGYGKIFDGAIFQPLFDRQNVTDFILTLRCIDGLGVLTGNICNATLSKGYDYAGIISAMAKKSMTSFKVAGITENLDKKTMPRAKILFGTPQKYLRDIANDNNAQYWMGEGELHINKLDDEYEGEAIVITPETGLIGTPQQITNGVSFRCFLNQNIRIKRPLVVVKLDNSIIKQQKLSQGQLVSPLDESGFYKVIKTVHVGDTRGNDWHTDVTGINLAGNVSALLNMVVN